MIISIVFSTRSRPGFAAAKAPEGWLVRFVKLGREKEKSARPGHGRKPPEHDSPPFLADKEHKLIQ